VIKSGDENGNFRRFQDPKMEDMVGYGGIAPYKAAILSGSSLTWP
jgi:hypothetical protein